MRPPLHRPLQLVTGKGGVGKTTLTHALARAHVEKGARPLVVELLPPDLADMPTERDLPYDVIRLDGQGAIVTYLERFVRVRRVAKAVAENLTLARFFRAAPGVEEVALYESLRQLADKGYKPIIVDLDATGHARMFLELPRVLDSVLGEGPMRSLIDQFSARLADPDQTALHIVALAEPLIVEETQELVSELGSGKAAALGSLFVNRLQKPLLLPEDRDQLAELARADRMLAEQEFARWDQQQAQFEQLRALPLPHIEIHASPEPSESIAVQLVEALR